MGSLISSFYEAEPSWYEDARAEGCFDASGTPSGRMKPSCASAAHRQPSRSNARGPRKRSSHQASIRTLSAEIGSAQRRRPYIADTIMI